MMSDGMRSGVNWMRPKRAFSAPASTRTSSVFAVPGTPSSSAWPRARNATSAWSITSSWPTTRALTTARTLAMSSATCWDVITTSVSSRYGRWQRRRARTRRPGAVHGSRAAGSAASGRGAGGALAQQGEIRRRRPARRWRRADGGGAARAAGARDASRVAPTARVGARERAHVLERRAALDRLVARRRDRAHREREQQHERGERDLQRRAAGRVAARARGRPCRIRWSWLPKPWWYSSNTTGCRSPRDTHSSSRTASTAPSPWRSASFRRKFAIGDDHDAPASEPPPHDHRVRHRTRAVGARGEDRHGVRRRRRASCRCRSAARRSRTAGTPPARCAPGCARNAVRHAPALNDVLSAAAVGRRVAPWCRRVARR